jgi:guanylate kinase
MGKTGHTKGELVVISGPSGVGKSTITKQVISKLEDTYLSVSATTRPQSASERNGKDYWFISKDEFEEKIRRGEFLEYAEVFGNYYGTPSDKVEQQLQEGKNVILEIDVQGGVQVKEKRADAVMIFILPPNESALAKRITGRGRDDETTAQKRLSLAKQEIQTGKANYEHFVVNDDLAEAVKQVIEIIKNPAIPNNHIH